MTAPMFAPLHPVQLTLDLRAPTARRRRADERRPYWQSIDLADVGGELRAYRPGVRALIAAHRSDDGRWIGYHDLVLGHVGSSGSTRPQFTRQDALASAAHGLAQPCRTIIARQGSTPKAAVTASRHLMHWLAQLDLL